MNSRKFSRTLLLLAGVFLGSAALAAAATLTATPAHKEFGVIDEGTDAVVMVSIHNTGSAPVEITNVQTS